MNQSRRRQLFVFGMIVVVAALASFMWLSQGTGSVSQESVALIEVGMSRSGVHEILGTPDLQFVNVGRVNGPTEFVTNTSLTASETAARGFSKHLFEQWSTTSFTAILIFDQTDTVACQYSSHGQYQSLLGRLWPRETVEWPPKASVE